MGSKHYRDGDEFIWFPNREIQYFVNLSDLAIEIKVSVHTILRVSGRPKPIKLDQCNGLYNYPLETAIEAVRGVILLGKPSGYLVLQRLQDEIDDLGIGIKIERKGLDLESLLNQWIDQIPTGDHYRRDDTRINFNLWAKEKTGHDYKIERGFFAILIKSAMRAGKKVRIKAYNLGGYTIRHYLFNFNGEL